MKPNTVNLESLDFDRDPDEYYDDYDGDWWREQDAAMEAEEWSRIETQAEIEDYRLNGYGE